MKQLIVLTLIFLFTTNIYGTFYYCDPINGNINNNGSITSPWTTLEAVFNQSITFSDGDKIFLLSGNHGYPKITGVNSSDVEIKPQVGHNPIIQRIRIGNISAAAYWFLNGLTIQSENSSQYPINLIDLYPNSSNITINNCTISSSSTTSTWNRSDWRTKTNNGILAKGTNHLFTHNTIKNTAIGITMSSSHSEFNENTIQFFTIDGIRGLGNYCSYIGNSILDNISVYFYSENHYDGFQSYSCCSVGNSIVNNVTIKGNIIINCTDSTRQYRGSMQGIGCFDGMYNNWTIENNIIIIDNWHGITLSGATNCKIANNTIIDPYDVSYQDPNDPQQFGNLGPAYIRVTAHKTDGGIYSGTLSTNNTVINNLVPTLANDANIGLVANNILLGSSVNYTNHFVDYHSYDLHLLATSLAIDSGTDNNAPIVDIEENQRPQGNSTDVGAYEYGCAISISQNGNQLTVNDSNGTIQWYLDGNIIPGVNGTNYTATMNGTYSVQITINNCSATSNFITIQDVIIKENNCIIFSIYPNPTTENFMIKTDLKIQTIQLLSIDGKLIMETSDKMMNVSKFNSGIYLIQIITTSGIGIKHVIIE